MKNLDVKSTLTTDEALEIAEQMQRIALGALYRSGPLSPANSVFHGGGAIRLAWASSRLSEDLDFLVNASLESDLERGVEVARTEIEQRMNSLTPGCTISLTRKKDLGTGTQRYLLRWYHPNRMGKVAVKLEFSIVRDEKLAQYPREVLFPGDPRLSPYEMRASISVPKPATSIADKLIAFAMREEIKWRDVYDLWFLSHTHRSWDDDRGHETLRAAVTSIAQIYNYEIDTVADRLDARAATVEATPIGDIAREIGRFLPREARDQMNVPGIWEDLRVKACEHARLAAADLRSLPPSMGSTP